VLDLVSTGAIILTSHTMPFFNRSTVWLLSGKLTIAPDLPRVDVINTLYSFIDITVCFYVF